MSPLHKLETDGFLVEGIAQTLLAMSTSGMIESEIGMSLDLLASVARDAAEGISSYVSATAAERRMDTARRGRAEDQS